MRCSAMRAAACGKSLQLISTRRASLSALGSGSPAIGVVTTGGGGRGAGATTGGAVTAGAVGALAALAVARGSGVGAATIGGAGGAEPQETSRLSPTTKGRPTRKLKKAIL